MPSFEKPREPRRITRRRSLMALIGGAIVGGAVLWYLRTIETGVETKPSEVVWQQIPSTTAPSPRSNHIAVLDTKRDRILIFGGSTGNAILNDVWEYDITKNSWSAINTSGKAPEPRFGHTAIYDSKGDRMIVYSGQGTGNRFFNDVWALQLDTNSWREIVPQSEKPETRYGSILVYDRKSHRALTFGGFTSQGRFDDTWALSLDSDSWQNLSSVGTRPMKRCLHTGVYDEQLGRLIIYGGQSVGALGDVWSLDVSRQDWRDITPKTNNPPPRFFATSIMDAERRHLVVFGGAGEGGKAFNDIWSLDLTNGSWSQPKASGTPPSNRQAHSTVFLSQKRKMIIFGGKNGTYLNDIWEGRL